MTVMHGVLERLGRSDGARRLDEVEHHAVGSAPRRGHQLGLIAVVDEHGPAAGAVARFDIVKDVADEPRLGKVDVTRARRAG
jgi:hypothetical protein